MPIESDGSVDPARLQKMVDKPHRFYRFIGAKIIFASKDRLVSELPVREDLANAGGNMHGGAVMALADHLGGAATILNLPAGFRTTTIESKTNFLAPIFIGDVARAECRPLHRGRSTMVWETRITRGDGRLVALIMQTQMVMRQEKPGPQDYI